MEPGDILLIRTGWVGWYRGLDEAARNALGDQSMAPSCGLSARESTAAMLWDLHIAAVGTDTRRSKWCPSEAWAAPTWGGIA